MICNTYCKYGKKRMLNIFFFSSRRRHTRCGRDWSSDVCSSDLAYPPRSLQHFRRQGNDLHELLVPKLTGHRPEDTGSDRLFVGVVQQNRRISVEADQRTVGTTDATTGANHHRLEDLALLDLATRNGFLHRDLDDVANVGIATV